MTQAKGQRGSSKFKIAIVVSEFNELITESLLKGATEVFEANDIKPEIFRVPGAFEIPLTCARVFEARDVDGILTLGAVIRGETPHFDYVAGQCASGVTSVSLQFKKPISFGVLTTDTVEQAMNRAGLKFGNKGRETAEALLQLLDLYSTSGI